MGSQIIRKPAWSAVGTKYGGMSIVALPLHFVLFAPTSRDFQLDKKEGQKREFLSQDVGWQIKTNRPTRIPPTPAVLSGRRAGYFFQTLVLYS